MAWIGYPRANVYPEHMSSFGMTSFAPHRLAPHQCAPMASAVQMLLAAPQAVAMRPLASASSYHSALDGQQAPRQAQSLNVNIPPALPWLVDNYDRHPTVSRTVPQHPAFYDWRTVFPQLAILRDNWRLIAEEALCATQQIDWPDWPEQDINKTGESTTNWKVFPFLHTFPANDPSKSKWIKSFCARCPRTASLLRSLVPSGLRTALFSRLAPGSRTAPHTGWADLSNHVLRCHLGLVVPPGGECKIWVDGEERRHDDGGVLVFDDSLPHAASNGSAGDRIVLLVDLVRPRHAAPGSATNYGHTPELDNLIDVFK